jgi:hypothetical protein
MITVLDWDCRSGAYTINEPSETAKSIKSLSDSVSAYQKRYVSVRVSAMLYSDSLMSNQLRYQAVKVSEAKANEEAKKLSRVLQELSRAQADSLAAGQLRYHSAVMALDKANIELRIYQQRLDSLRTASANSAKATSGKGVLNQSLRGEWEKFEMIFFQSSTPIKSRLLNSRF